MQQDNLARGLELSTCIYMWRHLRITRKKWLAITSPQWSGNLNYTFFSSKIKLRAWIDKYNRKRLWISNMYFLMYCIAVENRTKGGSNISRLGRRGNIFWSNLQIYYGFGQLCIPNSVTEKREASNSCVVSHLILFRSHFNKIKFILQVFI